MVTGKVGKPTTHSLKEYYKQHNFQFKTKKTLFNVRMRGLELNKCVKFQI